MPKLTAVIITCMLLICNASGENLLYITNVTRIIDLTNEFAGVQEKFNFLNVEAEPVTHFVYTLLSDKFYLVYLTARGGVHLSKLLWYKEMQLDDILAFSVKLDKPVEPGGASSVVIETALRDQLVEGHTEFGKDESKVLNFYIANQYVYSPYEIRHQTTKILARDQEKEISFRNKKPFSTSPLVFETWTSIPHIVEMDEFTYMLCEHKVRDFLWGKIPLESALQSCSGKRPPGPIPKDEWESISKPPTCGLFNNISETCAHSPPKNYFSKRYCHINGVVKELGKENDVKVMDNYHNQLS